MARINDNYLKLKAGYLFPEIGRRVREFTTANPDAKVIRLGIGDVTRPLAPAVLKAFHDAVDDLGTTDHFAGYGPEQGYDWLINAIIEKSYKPLGVSLRTSEMFISDGSKCDCANILDIFALDNVVAIGDPVYPVYNDTNVMIGRTGEADEKGYYQGVVYMPCTEGNDFVPELPEKKVDIIYLCSPNNPTGCLYPAATLDRLAAALATINAGRERPVFLLSDEPYRFLAYDGAVVPAMLPLSPFAVVAGSFSKSLSIAGERIGYLAIRPDMPDGQLLMQAVTLTTRTLGFVNAPVIGQRMALLMLNDGVDLSVYDRRRTLMARVLDQAGIAYAMPRGAFYFFPEAPGGDDLAFVNRLLEANILAVPGRGFGCPGHFRLSFSVETDVIERSADGFARAARSFA